MQVLTETALRAMNLNNGDTVTVERDSFVTESARRYAAERGIRIAGQEDAPPREGWQRMTRTTIDKTAEYPYVDDRTGQGYRTKPEDMTHLYGNRLVLKTDPRIAFRGKIDSLEADAAALRRKIEEWEHGKGT